MSLKHDLALCFIKLFCACLCVGLAVAQGLSGHSALPNAHPAWHSGVLLSTSKSSLPDVGELDSHAGNTPLPCLGSSGREESWKQDP